MTALERERLLQGLAAVLSIDKKRVRITTLTSIVPPASAGGITAASLDRANNADDAADAVGVLVGVDVLATAQYKYMYTTTKDGAQYTKSKSYSNGLRNRVEEPGFLHTLYLAWKTRGVALPPVRQQAPDGNSAYSAGVAQAKLPPVEEVLVVSKVQVEPLSQLEQEAKNSHERGRPGAAADAIAAAANAAAAAASGEAGDGRATADEHYSMSAATAAFEHLPRYGDSSDWDGNAGGVTGALVLHYAGLAFGMSLLLLVGEFVWVNRCCCKQHGGYRDRQGGRYEEEEGVSLAGICQSGDRDGYGGGRGMSQSQYGARGDGGIGVMISEEEHLVGRGSGRASSKRGVMAGMGDDYG
jgi:hypothetical protein